MTKEALEKEVRDYLRQQSGLNEGGIVSCNLNDLLLDFVEPKENRITELEKENEELRLKYLQATDEGTSWYHLKCLEEETVILKKALNLYVNWADECGIAWDNFPDEKEKWYKTVEDKGLGWVDGLVFMAIEEAKEQLAKEVKK